MENVISSEICQKCGQCCKTHPYIELSKPEVDAIAAATGWPVEQFAIAKEEGEEDYFLQFQENGDCFFLTENNGFYACAIYAVRPGLCAKYPTGRKQKDLCASLQKKAE